MSEADTNPQCTISGGGGSITSYPTNGMLPYTYLWSNGTTNQTDYRLAAGSYTCIVTDLIGCKDTVTATLVNPAPPNLRIVSFFDTICAGCPDTITVTGAKHYFWNPPTALNCSNCPNPIATISTTTTYTFIGMGKYELIIWAFRFAKQIRQHLCLQ